MSDLENDEQDMMPLEKDDGKKLNLRQFLLFLGCTAAVFTLFFLSLGVVAVDYFSWHVGMESNRTAMLRAERLNESLVDQNEKTQLELSLSKGDIAKLKKQSSDLQSQLDQQSVTRAFTAAAMKQQKEEEKKMSERLMSLGRELSAKQGANEQATAQKLSIDEGIAKAKEQMLVLVGQKETLDGNIQSQGVLKTTLTAEINQLQASEADLRAKLTSQHEALAKRAELAKENEMLQLSIVDQHSELARVRDDLGRESSGLDALEAKIQTQQQALASGESRLAEVQALTIELAQLRQEHADMQQKQSLYAQLKADTSALVLRETEIKERMATEEKHHTELKQSRDALAEELASLAARAESVKQATIGLDELKKQQVNLQNQVTNMQEKQLKLAQLTTQTEALAQREKSLTNSIATSETQYTEMMKRRASLTAQLASLEEQLAGRQQAAADVVAKNAALAAAAQDSAVLSEQLKHQNADSQRLTAEATKLKVELDGLLRQRDELRATTEQPQEGAAN